MKSTGSRDGSGCLLLIAGIVVLCVVSFVLTHLRTIVVTGVVVAALYLAVLLVRTSVRTPRKTPAGRRTAAHPTGHRTAQRSAAGLVEQARRAGGQDMRTAWLRCRLGVLPHQHRTGDASFVAGRLAEIPRADWDATRLRRHGQALWSLRDVAGRTPFQRDVEDRLDRVAAMLADRTDEEFDARLGQSDDRYVCHPDPAVRAAYLQGGSEGVEAIMRSISDARAQVRLDAAARAAADSLADQRNAALRAMRETHQPTEARDLHAAWEAQARQIDR